MSESGREFHKLIVEGMKKFEYVSVPAKGVTKHWLCPRVDVERGVSVIVVSTMPCNILHSAIIHYSYSYV